MEAYTEFLIKLPVLYDEIIYDEFVHKNGIKSRNDFIKKAIEEKFKKEKVDLRPKEVLEEKDWCDF
jgi:metal-responsive CopG/Arc/MetJ family transcriptional regulator